MKNKDIKVIVITYKDCDMPSDSMYFPICVGAGRDTLAYKFTPDNTGDNISDKNSQYSEFTALYWAWKNLDCDYLGLAQYRRHMTLRRFGKSLDNVLTTEEALNILKTNDAVAVCRKYPETVKNHYINCHHNLKEMMSRHIELLREIIGEMAPDYIDEFDTVMNGHKAYMFNMFIMKKADADEYCEWIFPILFEIERKIKDTELEYPRLVGTLGEFLLSMWFLKNKKKVKTVRLYQPELKSQILRFFYRRFFEK